ncbi:MAG: virulence RhuM family protein [Burkholderiales bacterium]|nr:virulence RhuM family protein [Burkholderiales bacterium]
MNEPLPLIQSDGTGEFVLYTTEDGLVRIEMRAEGGTLWLSQAAIATLFQTTPQNVTQHVKAIYAEGEADAQATCKSGLQVRQEGGREVRRTVRLYSLDVILAVGYRVRSHRGTQFRQWATAHLSDYLVKGFVLDDARFKAGGGSVYFDELLARIRDIRSSEKVFWRKVLDIYATSVDYDPKNDLSKQFFATVQNKMHWAVHGKTAAEVIVARADAGKPNMGLTHWEGGRPRRQDVVFAKNYLGADELDALNRIVNLYLEFAEGQALRRKPMTMAGWISKLDDFLRISDYAVLSHAGKVSHQTALDKAHAEFEKFRKLIDELPSPAEQHFEAAADVTPLLEVEKRQRKGRKGGSDAA